MFEQILIVDDHPLFREALRVAISKVAPEAAISEAATLEAAVDRLKAEVFSGLVLLDLKMPDCGGFTGLLRLRAEYPQIPVAIVTAQDDPQTASNALALGAAGFIPKSVSLSELSDAISEILSGEIWTPASAMDLPAVPQINTLAALSPAQVRILNYLRRGLLNKQIAFELEVTEATVKAHMTALFRKLGVRSRTQALILAQTLDSAVPAPD